MPLHRLLSVVLLMLWLSLPLFTVWAQAEDPTCPTIVETAIDITKEGCEDTRRDEACYGHLVLDAEPQPGWDEFIFEQPGDVVDITAINSLNLSALNIADGSWGVVLMQVQADLPEESQNDVTFLLFGDVGVSNAVQLIKVTPSADINIFSLPDETSDVLEEKPADEPITANGQTVDGDWLRVRVAADLGGVGWLAADQVTAEADISVLPIVSPEDSEDVELVYGPMQAFYFESGQDDAPCAEAPNSGMLIQTPEGVATVTVVMDEVVIELSGTGFVQAEADGELTLSVLDGSATVEANGESQFAIAGTEVSVPLDEDLSASGVPSEPQPINEDNLQNLPLALLDESVEIPEPVTAQSGVPTAGNWRFTWGVDEMTCPDNVAVPFQTLQPNTSVQVLNEGAAIVTMGVRHTRTSAGVYSALYSDTQGNTYRNTLRVASAASINGQAQITYSSNNCTLVVPFRLELVSAG